MESEISLVFLGSPAGADAVSRVVAEARPRWTTGVVSSAAELGDRLRAESADAAITELDGWLPVRALADALASASSRSCPLLVLVPDGTSPRQVVDLVRDGATDVIPRSSLAELPRAVTAALGRARGRAGDPLGKAMRLQSIGELTGSITHDLNNLLAIGTTFLELARDSLDPGDPVLADLDEAHGALSRAGGLTRRVVAFLRRDREAVRAIDLNDVVRSLDRLIECALGSRVKLVLDLAAELPLVAADTAELEQVILNLVLNARDAIAERGTVTIRTRVLATDAKKTVSDAVGKRVVLAINDDGGGMSEDVQRSIFEPFFTTKERGTGLGLSNAQQIVRRLRGAIRVRSELGKGSTFEVHLPTASRGGGARSSRPRR